MTEAEGKRSRIESDAILSTRSDNHEQNERAIGRRVSSAQSDLYASYNRTETSPLIGPARLPSGPPHPSKSTSPAVHSRSGFNSPRTAEHYSSLSASPRSALQKADSYESTASAMARDARGQTDANPPYPPTYSQGPSYPPSTTPPSYGSHYQGSIDLPSRRSTREIHRLPPLSHEDTTLSSDSGQGGYTAPYAAQTPLPMIDASKQSRVLPAPVPSGMASVPSPLDRPSVQLSNPGQQHLDFRTNSSLAALLRAGELARVADADADDEEMDMAGYQ